MSDIGNHPLMKAAERYIKELEVLKDRKKRGFLADFYHFGYCPGCNDITEISFSSDPEASPPRSFVRCLKCGGSNRCSYVDHQEDIKTTGDKIPKDFKEKWDKTLTADFQEKIHLEKMQEYLNSLDRRWKEDRLLHNSVKKKFKKFLPKENAKANPQ